MRRLLTFLAVLVGFATRSPAQHVLLVRTGGLLLPVRAVRGLVPQVEVDGRLEPADPTAAMLLHEADAYRDGFITADDFDIALRLTGFPPYRDDIQVDGFLTSTVDLQNCYLVVMWQTHSPNSFTFTTAHLPDLKAGRRITIRVWNPIPSDRNDIFVGQRYRAYIFSGRRECLTSLIAGKDSHDVWKQQEYFLRQAEYRQASAYFNPVPQSLGKLPAARPASAVVGFRISAEGDVLDPVVSGASGPEFGEFALGAVRQWIFAPAIREHRYVEQPEKLIFIFPAEPERPIPTVKEYLGLFAAFFGDNLIDLDRRSGLGRLAGRYRNLSYDQALADLKGRVDPRNPSVVVGEIERLSSRRIYVEAIIHFLAGDTAKKGSLRLDLVYTRDGRFRTSMLYAPSYSPQEPVEVQEL